MAVISRPWQTDTNAAPGMNQENIATMPAAWRLNGTPAAGGHPKRHAAAALFGLFLVGASAMPREANASGTTQVRIQATVMRHASIAAVRAPRSIAINAEDIVRGYLDLDEPIEVGIRTNAPEGVLLGLSLKSAAVRSVLLEGESGKLRVSRLGATLPVAKHGSGLGTQVVRLWARLELSPAALPGLIAFPVMLFVAPN